MRIIGQIHRMAEEEGNVMPNSNKTKLPYPAKKERLEEFLFSSFSPRSMKKGTVECPYLDFSYSYGANTWRFYCKNIVCSRHSTFGSLIMLVIWLREMWGLHQTGRSVHRQVSLTWRAPRRQGTSHIDWWPSRKSFTNTTSNKGKSASRVRTNRIIVWEILTKLFTFASMAWGQIWPIVLGITNRAKRNVRDCRFDWWGRRSLLTNLNALDFWFQSSPKKYHCFWERIARQTQMLLVCTRFSRTLAGIVSGTRRSTCKWSICLSDSNMRRTIPPKIKIKPCLDF